MARASLIGTVVICAVLSAQPQRFISAAEPPVDAMSVGVAERDITPEIGMEQPGGYGKVFHRSLHDPCKVRAAVFAEGETRVALVSLDALIIRREQVLAARERIASECGIPPKAVLIHATHSHSSGPTGMVLPGEYDHASELVQDLAYQRSSAAHPDYLKHVENQMVDCVVAADAARQSSQCSVGRGFEDKVAFNRRFRMRNGLTFTHPRPGNPDIVEPAGPIDPEVGVLGIWSDDGQLRGCIVNYACHATTSPGGISANYIYYLEQVIRGVFGDEVIVVFLAGASGDITQVDNLAKTASPRGEQWARLVGGSIGAEAVKVLLRTTPGRLSPVAFRSRVWNIPRRVPRAERLQEARAAIEAGPEQGRSTQWTFAKELLMLDALIQKTPEVAVEVQAIQIGPAIFLTNPAEFFCQLGLDIKAGSPFPLTFPVSLANGCVGYVPTEEAFGPTGGGYETRLTSYSNLDVTAGSQFVRAAVELSRELQPGTLPTRSPALPFQNNPWAYGSVPPERD